MKLKVLEATFLLYRAITVTALLFSSSQAMGAAITNLSLESLATGNHSFNADSQTFDAYVRNDEGIGWLLVGRGRNGWEFDSDGQGTVASVGVAQDLGTSAAFAPALYSDSIINDLIGNSDIDLTNVEIRFRRAGDSTGTDPYQEARWRPLTQTSWLGQFDSNYDVEQEIISGIGGPTETRNTNSRDAQPTGNNFTRIFTWAWSGHANQQGFSYGAVTTDGSNNSTNFWWENGNENHALAYTEVYIRSLVPVVAANAIPEPSTFIPAAFGLLSLGLINWRRRQQ
jgi:hypothetical protein